MSDPAPRTHIFSDLGYDCLPGWEEASGAKDMYKKATSVNNAVWVSEDMDTGDDLDNRLSQGYAHGHQMNNSVIGPKR